MTQQTNNTSIGAKKCGYVAILGAPNAGKSTLTNQLVGEKVSIISKKVQTTRTKILGIAMHQTSQIILVDTPGIFKPSRSLEKAMVNCAWDAKKNADVIIVLVDATKKQFSTPFDILNKLRETKTKQPILLVLNKIDRLDRQQLLPIVEQFSDFKDIIKDTFMISALKGDEVDLLKNYLANHLPENEWLYPEDQLSNLPQKLWASEITREQLYLMLSHELPYETHVETEKWEQFDNGSIKINQVIYVARDSQKKIILGNKGDMIKKIGMKARQELQYHMDTKVHLILYVKIVKDWMDKPHLYQNVGLDFTIT